MQEKPIGKKKISKRSTTERLYRFLVKWPKRIVIAILILLFLAAILIQLPPVQNYLKDQTLSKLETELNTEISISGFKFSIINGFYLQDLYVEDLNQDTLLKAAKLQVSLSQGAISLLKNELYINDIQLKQAEIFLYRNQDSTDYNAQFILDYFKSDSPKDNKINLDLETISLDNIRFRKQDDLQKKNFEAFVSKGLIAVDSIDLSSNTFAINSVNLYGPTFSMFKHLSNTAPKQDKESIITKKKNNPITLKVQHFKVNDGSFASDDFTKSIARDSTPNLIDFNHLALENIDIDIQAFQLDSTSYTGKITNLNLEEQSGFEIEQLSANKVDITNRQISLSGFLFKTPDDTKGLLGTTLQNDVTFKYNDFKDFKSFKNDVYIKAKLVDSKVAIRDILFFAKKLKTKPFIQLHKDKTINIDGDLFGKVKSPRSNNLTISLDNISLIGKVKASNIFDREHASLNLDVQQLKLDVQTLQMLLPNFKPPKSMYQLGQLNFKGKFEGFLNNFVAYGDLQTAIGAVKGDMNLDLTNGTENAIYSGQLSVKDFDLGQWVNNDLIGHISFNSSVKEGGGFQLKNAHAIMEGAVQEFEYKGYVYKDIFLKGKLEKNFFDGQLKSKTADLDFDFNGAVDYTDSIAKYNFDADVREFDLYKLNLAKKPLNVTGQFDLNLAGKNLKELEGKVELNDVRLVDKTDEYQLDSASIALNLSNPTNKFLIVESNLINAKLTGNFDLTTIPKAFKSDIIYRSPKFAQKLNISQGTDTLPHQEFEFAIDIPNTLNITKLLNINIDTFTEVNLSGNFNSSKHLFGLNASIGGIYLGSRAIRNTILDVYATANKLKLNSYVFETQLNSRRSLPPISLKVNLFPDSLGFGIKSSNINNVLKNVRINGAILPKDDYYQMQFNPSKIHVAQDFWQIDSDNYLRFSHDYLDAKNINFVSEDRQIELTTPTSNSLNLDLKNFDLSFINSFYDYPNFQYTGPFIANVQFDDLKNKKGLSLKLDANNLNINELAHGQFKLRANMPDFNSPLDVNLNIGENNHLATAGYVHFGKEAGIWKGKSVSPKSIYLNGELNDFPFTIMEDIIQNGISETAGIFDGKIKIEGPLTGPEFDGEANIRNGEITIDYLKTHYFINNQKIKITTTKFDATGKILEDRFGNKAVIRGGLTHRRFNKFGLDVSLNSDKFLVLDTKKGDNPLYYGRCFAEAFATFSGDFNRPMLRVVGKSLKDTDVKLLFTDEKQIGETNFVKFVSFKEEKEKIDATKKGTNTAAQGIEIDMQLELTDEADIQLIFDEISGDIIKSRGTGVFNAQYKPSGEFTLNGQYVINRGQYLFTLLNFINKPFIIEPGGTITWSKDPMKAELNIQALYQGLSAPIYSLIKEELNTIGTSSDIEDAQRPSPIDLGLILTGPMLQPNIAFTLDIQNLVGNNKNYVANKLSLIESDPNELNRQVFGLLVFGGFLSPGNSLGLEESGAVRTGIASTISELLSSQFALYVNSLLSEVVGTGKFYSGMEVDVGLNIYQTYQTTSEFNTGVQSSAFQFNLKNHFFNNRVTIQLGGNVGLDDNLPTSTNSSDFSGDILIEIVLSKNRRYRMQVYNKFAPDYTGTVKNRMKSGVGISYQKEFNSFQELFKGLKKAVKN